MMTNVSRLHPPPPRLAELLRLVNLVPPDRDLSDLSASSQESPESIHEALAKHLGALPKEFAGHVWEEATLPWPGVVKAFDGVTPTESHRRLSRLVGKKNKDQESAFIYRHVIRRALSEYEFIRRARENLLIISRAAEESDIFLRNAYDIKGTYRIQINDKGIVDVQPDRFVEAIDEVDATRIRVCENCEQIFWAGRVDAVCCSTRCSNNLRNQIARFLRSHGYLANVELKPKDEARKAELIAAWRAQRKARNPYGNL